MSLIQPVTCNIFGEDKGYVDHKVECSDDDQEPFAGVGDPHHS